MTVKGYFFFMPPKGGFFVAFWEKLGYTGERFSGKEEIVMKLEQGRPVDFEAREAKEQRVYALLDGLEIAYQRIDHEAAMTMEACREVDEALGATICKNLLLCNRQGTAYYLLMLPGEKTFKTSVFSKLIGSSRLSFAPGEAMVELLDILPGSLSVMGLMNDRENRVTLYVDGDILRGEFVGCHPCVNTSSLRIRTADLVERIIPAMGHEMHVVEL